MCVAREWLLCGCGKGVVICGYGKGVVTGGYGKGVVTGGCGKGVVTGGCGKGVVICGCGKGMVTSGCGKGVVIYVWQGNGNNWYGKGVVINDISLIFFRCYILVAITLTSSQALAPPPSPAEA